MILPFNYCISLLRLSLLPPFHAAVCFLHIDWRDSLNIKSECYFFVQIPSVPFHFSQSKNWVFYIDLFFPWLLFSYFLPLFSSSLYSSWPQTHYACSHCKACVLAIPSWGHSSIRYPYGSFVTIFQVFAQRQSVLVIYSNNVLYDPWYNSAWNTEGPNYNRQMNRSYWLGGKKAAFYQLFKAENVIKKDHNPA